MKALCLTNMALASAPSPPPIWLSPAWAALAAHASSLSAGPHLRELLQDAARCAALVVEHDGVVLDFARQRATAETLRLLVELADAAGLRSKIDALASGARINITEDRAVLHMALRAPRGSPPLLLDGVDVHADVHAVQDRIAAFASAVRSGAHVGVTGKPLRDVVSVGIGGRCGSGD